MELPDAEILFGPEEIEDMVSSLAGAILERCPDVDGLALVGIRTGGVYLAKRLLEAINGRAGSRPESGVMDITLYRDDWTRAHNRPKVGPTEIPFEVGGRSVILVDDVLYTGRTIRAAMDALIDFGRPTRIGLAVLIDRGGRELPIQPDHVGATLEVGPDQVIDVHFSEGGAHRDQVVMRPKTL